MRFWDSSAVVPLLVQQPQSEFATLWAGGRLDRVFHTFNERLAHAARLEGFVVPSDAAD